MNNNKKVAIIGAGLGGLATACYLAKAGYSVVIYEKNKEIGGRAGLYQEKGYTFDTGPSWYWMPEIFEKFFADFGKKSNDYYTLEKIEPAYRVFFSAKEIYDIPSDADKIAALIDTIEKGSGKRLQNILKRGKSFLNMAVNDFLYKDYPDIRPLLKWE